MAARPVRAVTPPIPPTAAAGTSAGRWRLLPRNARGWAALVFCVLVGLGVFAWMLSRMTPPWHAPLDPSDNWVIDESVRVQNLSLELHNAIQRVPLGEQTWNIKQDEINAFLAVRFAPPLNPDGTRSLPSAGVEVSEPVVTFTPAKVTVSARLKRLGGPHPSGGVGSLVFTVGTVPAPDGTRVGTVRLSGAWVGRLPIPTAAVGARIRAALPALVGQVANEAVPLVGARKVPEITPAHIDQLIRIVLEGETFPLVQTYANKPFIIKEMKIDAGEMTVVLAPTTPAAVRPRPRGN